MYSNRLHGHKQLRCRSHNLRSRPLNHKGLKEEGHPNPSPYKPCYSLSSRFIIRVRKSTQEPSSALLALNPQPQHFTMERERFPFKPRAFIIPRVDAGTIPASSGYRVLRASGFKSLGFRARGVARLHSGTQDIVGVQNTSAP